MKKYPEIEEEVNVLNEPAGIYLRNFSNFTHFNSSNTYDKIFKDKLLMVQCINNGVTYSFFKAIQIESPFSENQWASFLDISYKSIQRYKMAKDFVFRPIHSEKILEIAEVINLGKRVFDTTKQFYLWLTTSSFALGNNKPMDLISNSYGIKLINAELYNIEYGIFS